MSTDTRKRTAPVSPNASSSAKRLRADPPKTKEQVHEWEQDQAFRARVKRLYTPAQDLEQQMTARAFPRRQWQWDEKRRVFYTPDTHGPPLEVAEAVVHRLHAVLPPGTVDSDAARSPTTSLVVHLSQWVLDRDTKLYQWVAVRPEGDRAYVLNAAQLCQVYGETATADHQKLVREAKEAKNRTASSQTEHKACVASAASEATVPFPPLAAVESVGERDRDLYREIVPMLESVRQGVEPEASPKLLALAQTEPFLSRLLHLQQHERVLTIEDVDMILTAVQQRDTDMQYAAVLSRIPDDERPSPDGWLVPDDDADERSPAKAKAKTKTKAKVKSKSKREAVTAPTTAKQKRQLSRKLFGVLPTLRRQAACLGYQLVRVPVTLATCGRCAKARIVDQRASTGLRSRFVCGADIQINNDVECGAPDEELRKASEWVFQEPLPRLVFA